MSGIFGLLNLDGRPAERPLLKRMASAIAHRGPDGDGLHVEGPVGLGHRMLHTTPESLHEVQPLRDETGEYCLTLDGRVDNRDKLRAELDAAGFHLRDDTDAELVLRAYQAWGESSPDRLVGDFAFALWDGRRRRLFCARDYLGSKPFCYAANGSRFIFASELHVLFADPALPREPNEGVVGEFLANRLTSTDETLFRGIHRLPAGHAAFVDASGMRTFRHWRPDPARKIRCRDDGEYADRFREVFQTAVLRCARSSSPLAVDLSGGLDSSSIACMLAALRREGTHAVPDMKTFSVVFPGLPCDETDYSREVARRWDLNHAELPCLKPVGMSPDAQVRRYLDFPDYPNGSPMDPIKAAARDEGFRVRLRGLGGDEWLNGSLLHCADLVRSMRILDLLKNVRPNMRLGRIRDLPVPHLPILRYGLWPLLPLSLRNAVNTTLGRNPLPRWIPDRFARRLDLPARVRPRALDFPTPTHATREMVETGTFAPYVRALELEERMSSFHAIEERNPFLDKDLVEFALALPEEQRWQRGQLKYVLRNAMRGLLPERVRMRDTKARFSHVYLEALKATWANRPSETLAIGRIGWVNEKTLDDSYQEMLELYFRRNPAYVGFANRLMMVRGIDLWYRYVFLEGR